MRRWYLGPALGLAALVAALTAAFGPAIHESAVYDWPPLAIPEKTPSRAWYTPMLLANRIPASIDATIPCELPKRLSVTGRSATILKSARRPARVDGLLITADRRTLGIAVGSRRIATVPWPPPRKSCPFRISVSDGELTIPGRTLALRSSHPDGMPSVSALFSELDLRNGTGFHVAVATRTYATTPSTSQIILTCAAVLLAALALLVALGPLNVRELRRQLVRSPKAVARAAGAHDLAVAAFLLAWTILAPPTVDDGWVWIRQRTFPELGTFTNYFENYGASLPLDYWLEWLQHWVSSSTSAIAIQRLPTLAALLGCWMLARWCCRHTVGQVDVRTAHWVLASVFILVAAAWDMTTRPEPFVALLVGISVAGALSFASSPSAAPLTLGFLAVTFAVTAHPEGVTTLAPLAVVSGSIVAWVRSERSRMATIAAISTSCAAIATVLAFLDTDVATWRENRRLFSRFYADESPWWYEPARYLDLARVEWWATPLRQGSVAILLLVVLAYLARRLTGPRPALLGIPAASLAVALVLMTLNPTKSPYHFGSLAVLGAVAAAAECAGLLAERSPRRSLVRSLVAVVVLSLILTRSLRAEGFWNPLDLQTRSWIDPTLAGVDVFNPLPWLVAAAFACLAALAAHRRDRRSTAPRHIAAWSVPATVAILVGLTATVIGVDAVRADWALPRQNLSALAGSDDCGLAEVVRITRRTGSEPRTASLAVHLRREGIRALLEPAPAPYFPCADTPTFRSGLVEVPHLIVGWQLEPWPVTVPASPFRGLGDLYPIVLLHYDDSELTVHEVHDDVPGSVLLPAVLSSS